MGSVAERAEIEERYKWSLDSVYETPEEWERAFETVGDRLDELRDFEGSVTDSAEQLRTVLELRDDIMRDVETVAAFARMRSDEDTRNQEAQAMAARSRSLAAEASSAASFVEPEIQSLDADHVRSFVESEPGLEPFEFYLMDVLRLKSHTRSSEVEAVISDLSDVVGAGGDIYTMLLNADMTFPSVENPQGEAVEITQANLVTLLRSSDRDFRNTVHDAFYGELGSVRNTVGEALANTVKTHVKLARAHNYETAREANLDEPNIPVEVYDTLTSTVRDNLDALHRHVEVKRDALDIDEFRMWDIYTPMIDTEPPEVAYESAVDHVLAALEPLGEAYTDRVGEGIESRWIDVHETRGKRDGAYSSGTYDTQPFILMNWQQDITSMYTLAHELGHSMHSELIHDNQPYRYSHPVTFTAEVASTVNEALLTQHLMDTLDDGRFRRHVLVEQLERIRSTLFRQTLFAEFEHRIHTIIEDGDALTPDRLDDLYRELKAAYYEPAIVDDRIVREWMRITHFFQYEYYVFQYATGISAALALSRRILEGDDSAADRYLSFLRQGSHGYPLELLREAGVDMATARPIEAAIGEYERILAEVEGDIAE